jgi:2-hydroxychromene-2-carboxylate isomerase
MPEVTFYFDLGSPYAYLSAERVEVVLGQEVVWQPILLGAIFRRTGRSSWALDPALRTARMAEVERRAALYGLPPVRWPGEWPSNYLVAMRAATFAACSGLGREFALAGFRAAFRDGGDLAEGDQILSAGISAGFEIGELGHGVSDQSIKDELREATAAAHDRGVIGVPSFGVGAEVIWGDDRLEQVAALV